MNTVAIMQPSYAGWLGYFSMLDESDLFILLDVVAMDRQSWQSRNRLIDRNGNEVWLSIPVHAEMGQILNTVEIAENGRWRKKHQGTIHALGKGRRDLEPLLELYDREWFYLVDFTKAVFAELAFTLGIGTPIVTASSYGLPCRDNPVERLADLCECAGADEFLNAAGAEEALGLERLPFCGKASSIPIRYHAYKPEPYAQGISGFVSHMSVVDCLARYGAKETLRVIRAGRRMSSER